MSIIWVRNQIELFPRVIISSHMFSQWHTLIYYPITARPKHYFSTSTNPLFFKSNGIELYLSLKLQLIELMKEIALGSVLRQIQLSFFSDTILYSFFLKKRICLKIAREATVMIKYGHNYYWFSFRGIR